MKDFYTHIEFKSLMVWGMKLLQNLVVLLLRLRVKIPCLGCVLSLERSLALARLHLSSISWIERGRVPYVL